MLQQREIRFLVPPLIFVVSLAWAAIVDPNILVLPLIHILVANGEGGVTGLLGAILAITLGSSIIVITIGFLIGEVSVRSMTLLYQCLNRWYRSDRLEGASQWLHPWLQSWPLVRGLFRHLHEDVNVLKNMTYEVELSKEALKRMREAMGVRTDLKVWEHMFETGAAYDHVLLKQINPGLHEWMGRRFNHLIVSGNSCVAIFLSWGTGVFLGLFLWRKGYSTSPKWDQGFTSWQGFEATIVWHFFSWFLPSAVLCWFMMRNASLARREIMNMIEFISGCDIGGTAAIGKPEAKLPLTQIRGDKKVFGHTEELRKRRKKISSLSLKLLKLLKLQNSLKLQTTLKSYRWTCDC